MAHDTVLVVEDDAAIATLMEWTISSEGLEVVVVGDAASAQAALQNVRPALMLMDLQLPSARGGARPPRAADVGLALIQATLARPERIPLVVVTADPVAAEVARALGATDVLLKPFDLPDLLDILARYTGTHHD